MTTTLHGFELVREQTIPELNTRARLWKHIKTGAQLLSMENDDENKVFGITFATPPNDSTGLPHIMEHSVLCGSRKYPLKEPFIELVKGSLKTFLNAFTFSDKTCYPVASQNVQDLYNLIDVYLDAVFYPRISPETLMQEGWHYELEDPSAPLTYKGVVFNEMKGAYSSPDNLLGRLIEQSLLPDTPYGFDSGGDPRAIPNLTYEQFKRFHETYYHPSNALIYFYGDDDPAKRLEFVDGYLRDFERKDVKPTIPLQPRFETPLRLTYGYDAGEEGVNGKKAMVAVNWLLTDALDAEMTLALQILAYILIGTPASPLKKALIDSGLGEDLAGVGLEDQTRQVYFSTGLKGIAPEDAERVEQLILDTLATLHRDGIEPEMIEAALNTVEFRLREWNTGSFPRGLAMMIAALGTWLHDGDPLARLAFEAPLNRIKARVSAGERYFEELIDQYFLKNPHRTTTLLKPDPEKRARDEAEEQDRLAQAREAMSEADIQRVIETTRRLKLAQETPDPPELLATLPSLRLEDLERENKRIPIEIGEQHGVKVLYHDLFTNGILYLDLGFDLHTLPGDLLPYIPLFSRALLEMGTETEDYVKLSQRIGRKTGGLHASPFVSSLRDAEGSAAWLFLRGKGTMSQVDDLLEIARDILLTVKLDNPARFRQMVLEDKASHEARLAPAGHAVANLRLRSQYTEADWASEQFSGVSQLFFLRDLARAVESEWPVVLEKLETIRQTLLRRGATIANVTLDEANWQSVQPKLGEFLSSLPEGGGARAMWQPPFKRQNEGLTIPAQVNYVGKGANLYALGYEHHGSVAVIANYLRTTWLWDKIRVQGGAYGAFCGFDSRSGVFTFLSYRDPNLLNTLDTYDRTSQFLRDVHLDDGELTRSIIGTIGSIDAYQLPDAKGFTSMVWHLVGDTDDIRQEIREEMLSTSVEHFRAFAGVLERLNEQGTVVAVGSQEAIQQANAQRGDFLTVTKVL